MPEKTRTYNSIVNSLYGIVASIITVALNFVVRVVLVRELGEEINGLHNLFQSITSVMILMEMGISAAMVIHLYEPIKKNNVELICGIMGFYKRIYTGISIAFTAISIIVALFILDSLVTTSIPIGTVRLYFVVYTISFTVNYLTYYKRSILYAEQKNRVAVVFTTLSEIVLRSLQILLLLVYHNYLLFVILTIIEKATSNILCAYYVNKRHPYLRSIKKTNLRKEIKVAIFRTIKPLMVNQTANTIQLASRSILISILLGNVAIVGYYGNYQLLTNIAQMVYAQFGGAFTSSMGNFAVDNNKEMICKVYRKSAFIMNWIACIGCALFIACADDFIYLVFGANFVLDHISVFILSINLGIYLLNIPMISLQNAMGLHKYDASNMVIQAALSVALGYLFGKFFGMPGIFLGLLIPLIIFTLIMKGIIIGGKSLGMSPLVYISFIVHEVMKIVIVLLICNLICSLVGNDPSFGILIIKMFVGLTVSLFIPAVMSFRKVEFKETIYLINKIKKGI